MLPVILITIAAVIVVFLIIVATLSVATEHICGALAQTVPMARTMAEKVASQRNWSTGRARNASIPRIVETNGN